MTKQERILKRFAKESSQMAGLNNCKLDEIVWTDSYDKAVKYFDDLFETNKPRVTQYRRGFNGMHLTIENTYHVRWIAPSQGARAYRCSHCVIDLDLDDDILNCIVIPCSRACSKDDVAFI